MKETVLTHKYKVIEIVEEDGVEKEVEVEMEQDYPMLLNNQALVFFEDETGMNPLSGDNLSYKHILILLHCSLMAGAKYYGMTYNKSIEETFQIIDETNDSLLKLDEMMEYERLQTQQREGEEVDEKK